MVKLQIEEDSRITGRRKPSKEVAFYVERELLERWQTKVRGEGRSYSKVIEALMRWYLGEKLPKPRGKQRGG
jgi:hypothetical protein